MWSRSRAQADFEEYRGACRHAERAFNKRSKASLTNAPNPRKRRSAVKGAAFGLSSSWSPEVGRGEWLVWSADKKAPLFSAHLDAKQCRNSFQQPYSCDPCPMYRSVAFRSSFVFRLPLDPDPYVVNDLGGMFPLFYKQVAWELVPKLAVIFRQWVTGGSLRNVG